MQGGMADLILKTEGRESVIAAFRENLKKEIENDRVSLLIESSDDAFLKFFGQKFDLVFIDGDHHSPVVDRDVENYFKLVRLGGIFCGHDYKNTAFPAVRRAVDKKFGDKVKMAGKLIWYVEV